MARPPRFIERVVYRRIVGESFKFVVLAISIAKLLYGAAAAAHLFGYTP